MSAIAPVQLRPIPTPPQVTARIDELRHKIATRQQSGASGLPPAPTPAVTAAPATSRQSVVAQLKECMTVARDADVIADKIIASLLPLPQDTRPQPDRLTHIADQEREVPGAWRSWAALGLGGAAAGAFSALGYATGDAKLLPMAAGAAGLLGVVGAVGLALARRRQLDAAVKRGWETFEDDALRWGAEQRAARVTKLEGTLPLATFEPLEKLYAAVSDEARCIVHAARVRVAFHVFATHGAGLTPHAEAMLLRWTEEPHGWTALATLATQIRGLKQGNPEAPEALCDWFVRARHPERAALAAFVRGLVFDGEKSRFPMPHRRQVELLRSLADAK